MSVIESVVTFIETYAGLDADAPVWVNYLGKTPTEYGIVPLPGGGVVNTYINGTEIIDFPFAFQSAESVADDPARVDNIAFLEAFSNWIKTQNDAGTFPTLGAGETPRKIESLGWGFLLEESESGTGVYQVQCNLEYRKA